MTSLRHLNARKNKLTSELWLSIVQFSFQYVVKHVQTWRVSLAKKPVEPHGFINK